MCTAEDKDSVLQHKVLQHTPLTRIVAKLFICLRNLLPKQPRLMQVCMVPRLIKNVKTIMRARLQVCKQKVFLQQLHLSRGHGFHPPVSLCTTQCQLIHPQPAPLVGSGLHPQHLPPPVYTDVRWPKKTAFLLLGHNHFLKLGPCSVRKTNHSLTHGHIHVRLLYLGHGENLPEEDRQLLVFNLLLWDAVHQVKGHPIVSSHSCCLMPNNNRARSMTSHL